MAARYLIQPLRYGAERGNPAPPAPPIPPEERTHTGVAVTEDADRHLRDKILAVLFTAPGERVNRPRFGVGLNRFIFEGLDELALGALEFRVNEGLRRDIGDELLIDGIDVTSAPADGEVRLSIRYRRREDRVPRQLDIDL
jgi:phage baseplate assembly protein W